MFSAPKFYEKGGEGVAFAPATPNGTTNLPAEITKVFFSKEQMNSAIDHVETARTVLGNLQNNGTKITPYSTKLTKNQIPRFDPDLEEPYSAVHMPWLGHSISQISKLKEGDRLLGELRGKLPALLKDIVRVLKQVQRINEKGYVHGDIRDQNVLVDPRTGGIRIIDYGWFLPKKDFMDTYGGFGFYSGPPEYLLMFAYNFRETLDGKSDVINEKGKSTALSISEEKWKDMYDDDYEDDEPYSPWGLKDPCYISILIKMVEGTEVPDKKTLIEKFKDVLNWVAYKTEDKEQQKKIKVSNLERFHDTLSSTLDEYAKAYKNCFGVPTSTTVKDIKVAVKAALREFYKRMVSIDDDGITNDDITGFFEDKDPLPKEKKLSSLNTFDSFGLASTLRKLLFTIAPEMCTTDDAGTKPHHAVYQMVKEVLDPLAEFNAFNRKTIGEILTKAEHIATMSTGGSRRMRKTRKMLRMRKIQKTRSRRRI